MHKERQSVRRNFATLAVFLGSVGALNNAKHTANDLNELKQYSAYTNEQDFIHRQAVSDNKIITANGTATLEFAQEILKALSVASDEQIKGWYDFHKLGFYNCRYAENVGRL